MFQICILRQSILFASSWLNTVVSIVNFTTFTGLPPVCKALYCYRSVLEQQFCVCGLRDIREDVHYRIVDLLTYDPWFDKSSKLQGYTCGTYTQPQHVLPRAHCANLSKGARCMGLTCICPVSSTTRTIRVYHHNPEASLAHEMREQPTVLAVTVTSCVGETSVPSVSPEDISDHPPINLPTQIG